MTKETGGPAFPTECCNTGIYDITGFDADNIPAHSTAQYQGMNLRDYFAGLAMQALIPRGMCFVDTTKHAYANADAMLQERNKP